MSETAPAFASIHSVFQPIVALVPGEVVGFEALARTSGDPGAPSPQALFTAARASGRLAELEWACRAAALEGALRAGVAPPLTVFVNVEPEVPVDPPAELRATLARARRRLRVVAEITERALALRPAELLRTVRWIRRIGWGIALDDVGADPLSIALMPLLRPDVVKLDLGLVRRRPDLEVAEVVTAVSAYAQRTGATVLAEGIETEEHRQTALAMGASLGQGWLFGRPDALAGPPRVPRRAAVPERRAPAPPVDGGSVFDRLAVSQVVQRPRRPLLQAISGHLERQAMACGPMTVLLACMEHARFFGPGISARYQQVAQRAALVAVLGEAMPVQPVLGVTGARLLADDPLRGEWAVVVVSPHFAAALVARDLGDAGPASRRRFDYVLTYDRELAVTAATALMGRVTGTSSAGSPLPELRTTVPAVRPGTPRGASAAAPDDTAGRAGAAVHPVGEDADLRSAFEHSPVGMAVLTPEADVLRANAALTSLLGLPVEQVVGRDLFGVTHPEDRDAAREACRSLREDGDRTVRHETRFVSADGTVTPVLVTTSRVTAADGDLVRFVMHIEDISAQKAMEAELTHRALHDALTGLPNRTLFLDRLDHALARAARDGQPTAVLFCDLDGFKTINDGHGHHVGDAVLVETAHRLRGILRPGDTAARWGGDEFTVLCERTDAGHAAAIAQRIRDCIAAPLRIGDQDLTMGATVGAASTSEPDARDAEGLLRAADAAMYRAKAARDRRRR